MSVQNSSFGLNIAGNVGGGIANANASLSDVEDSLFCGNEPDHINGPWNDLGGTLFSEDCESCVGDINLDGVINVDDVLALIAAWGTDDEAADVNGDGVVDTDDLLAVIGTWGPCE